MTSADSQILTCPKCGARNRVPREKAGKNAKCHQCGTSLNQGKRTGISSEPEVFVFRCPECGARNKIPEIKRKLGL